MALIGATVAVSKRTGRTYIEEDGRPGVDTGMNRMPSRSSGDDTGAAPAEPAEKEYQVGRALSAPVPAREVTRGGEPMVEVAPDKTVAMRISSSEKGEVVAAVAAVRSAMWSAVRPLNFGLVIPGVYRCSQPTSGDFDFLTGLGLRTVISLVRPDKLDTEYGKFMAAHNINHHMISMRGTKKESIPLATMKSIMDIVLDRQHHPLLLHCSHGKHRTGCVVAVVRKVSGWKISNILDEYRSYAEPKVRDCDVQYITGFQTSDLGRHSIGSISSIGISSSSSSTTAMARPGPWSGSFRIRNFFRAVLFSAVVLLVFMASTARISATQMRMK